MNNNTIQTIYYSKRFLSGNLTGLTVHQSMTASPSTLANIRIGAKGKDYGTRARWIIVDASYQNYAR
jgi:hypothetical protein